MVLGITPNTKFVYSLKESRFQDSFRFSLSVVYTILRIFLISVIIDQAAFQNDGSLILCQITHFQSKRF